MSNQRTRSWAAIALSVAILAIGGIGAIVTVVVNAFVISDAAAYGEVPIPGTADLELPAGDVYISYRANTLTVGAESVAVPPLRLSLDPPAGVARPVIDDTMNMSSKSNRQVTVRVFTAHVEQAGTYRVAVDGPVFASQNPRLVFGHGSSYYWLVWPFVAVAVLGAVALVASIIWAVRAGRRIRPLGPPGLGAPPGWPPMGPPASTNAPNYAPTYAPSVPDDRAIRIEQLKNIAALRDSGALTEAEFEAEKRRILDS